MSIEGNYNKIKNKQYTLRTPAYGCPLGKGLLTPDNGWRTRNHFPICALRSLRAAFLSPVQSHDIPPTPHRVSCISFVSIYKKGTINRISTIHGSLSDPPSILWNFRQLPLWTPQHYKQCLQPWSPPLQALPIVVPIDNRQIDIKHFLYLIYAPAATFPSSPPAALCP